MIQFLFLLLNSKAKTVLPDIQGGMAVSAHELAETVAREGTIGRIFRIDL